MAEYASRGVAGAGLGTGIAGLSLGVLNAMNGGLGGLFNWGGCANRGVVAVSDCGVNHNELLLTQENARLQSEVALRDANIYNDQKLLEVYKYFDGEVKQIREELCQQRVVNATQVQVLNMYGQQICALQDLTKIVIPRNNICPEVMPRYNTWVAPTTSAPDTQTVNATAVVQG